MSSLHLFHIDDGETHSVIAADEDDALAVVIEFGGIGDDVKTPTEYRGAVCDLEIKQLDDNHLLTITYDDHADAEADGAAPGELKVRKTAAEWAAGGRAYLGGSCW